MISICYVPIFFRISHNKNNMYFTVYWWYSHGSPWTHGILSICASMVIPLCFAGFCGSHFLWVFRYFSYARLAIVLPSSWSTILLLWPKRDLWAASWRKVDMQMIAILRPPKGPKTNGWRGCFFQQKWHVKNGGFFTEWQPLFRKNCKIFSQVKMESSCPFLMQSTFKNVPENYAKLKEMEQALDATWAKRFAKHTVSQSESCSVLVSLSPKNYCPIYYCATYRPLKNHPKTHFPG